MIRWEPRCDGCRFLHTHTHTDTDRLKRVLLVLQLTASFSLLFCIRWKRKKKREKHSRVHDYTVERRKTSATATETIISQLKLASRHFLLLCTPAAAHLLLFKIIIDPFFLYKQFYRLFFFSSYFHFKRRDFTIKTLKNRAAHIKFEGGGGKGERSRRTYEREKEKKNGTTRCCFVLLAAGVVGDQFSRRRLIFFFLFRWPFPTAWRCYPCGPNWAPASFFFSFFFLSSFLNRPKMLNNIFFFI